MRLQSGRYTQSLSESYWRGELRYPLLFHRSLYEKQGISARFYNCAYSATKIIVNIKKKH